MQDMSAERRESSRRTFWSAVGLIVAAGMARLAPHPPNFTPVGAMALFGGARLRWGWAFVLPLAVMYATDVVLWKLTGLAPFNPFVYGCFLLDVLLGRLLLRKATPWRIGVAALLSTAQFFAVTNFGVWLTGTMYPHTAGGLLACYAAGLPFARNMLCADLFYSAVLFGAAALVPVLARRKASQPV
jgi:hypothetical protein